MFRRLIVVLALVVWMPSNGWAPGFDFALDAFQVSGNATFFDDFNDGNRNTAPTSLLDDRGGTVTTESGGFLILTDTDGADSQDTPFGTVLSDIGFFESTSIPDGGWSYPGSVYGQALGFVDLRSRSLSYAMVDK